MDSQERIQQSNIIPALILAFILLAGTGLFFWQAGFFNKEKELYCTKEYPLLCDTKEKCESNNLYWWDEACHSTEKPKPSEYPDFESLTTLKNTVLVENFDSYTPDGKILNQNIKSGIILRNGKLSKGYLEIKASKDNKPLTVWESIYFKAPYGIANDNLFGGHIFRPNSLKVPTNDKTHLLFALNEIPFLSSIPYSESATPKKYDLFKILNENKEVNFLTFISSLNPAKIESIKIYYECDKTFNDGNCEITTK